MTLSEEEQAVIIGCIIASVVVIIFGILLCFCDKCTPVDEIDYSQLYIPTNEPQAILSEDKGSDIIVVIGREIEEETKWQDVRELPKYISDSDEDCKYESNEPRKLPRMSLITQLLCEIIDTMNNEKLNGKKDDILEWIETNQHHIPQLKRKDFINDIAKHCKSMKIRAALGKVFNEYEEERKYEDDTASYAHDEQAHAALEQMPTYIHRAIWSRSDDETLEQLMDLAVTCVCNNNLWNDADFIRKLYDAKGFEQNVNGIFGTNLTFFDDFIQTTFKREIALEGLREERPNLTNSDSAVLSLINDSHVDKSQHTHKVYYDSHACGYHIYTADGAMSREDCMCSLNVPKSHIYTSGEFEWAVWKNCGEELRKEIHHTGSNQKTHGLWEILNGNERGVNVGVPINHLNIIFELLRWCSRRKSNRKVEALHAEVSQLQDEPLQETYCVDPYEPRKVNIDIYIHDDQNHNSHYTLIWWNCGKRTACNAIAIKNMTRVKDTTDVEQKYYLRFKVSDLAYASHADKPIKWQWYDNDASEYKSFSDYKEGLLHKQMEATYQANIDKNFPWRWFDKFNGAQLSHLAPALATNGVHRNSSYLIRFSRLSFAQEKNQTEREENAKKENVSSPFGMILSMEQVAVNKRDHTLYARNVSSPFGMILSMEQVAVNKRDHTLYARNVRRLRDGKDSLQEQYHGRDGFVYNWLKKYQLASAAQKKYFWSFILSIVTKIKLMDIEIEDQLVTS
eukprot:646314_1